jgi:hypothetical protein
MLCRVLRLFVQVGVAGLLLPGLLLAYEEPVGDVDPVVRVENGNFTVYFTNNTSGDDNSREVFRTVYSPLGQLLAPRHHADPATIRDLDLDSDNLSRVSDSSTYSMPQYYREHFGRPYYIVHGDGGRERHKIPWRDGTDIDEVHDMTVSNSSMWLTGCASGKHDLCLYRYEIGSLEPPTGKDLGEVSTIDDFPVASNLLILNNCCYIVWCRLQKERYELVLSKWDGTSNGSTDTVLSNKVDFGLPPEQRRPFPS